MITPPILRHLALASVIAHAACAGSAATPTPPPTRPPDASLADAPPPPPPDDARPATSSDAFEVPETPTPTCTGGLIARVVAIKLVDNRTALTVAAGARRGVQPTWRATLTRPRVPAHLVRVDANVTIVTITVTFDQIPQRLWVELCPP